MLPGGMSFRMVTPSPSCGGKISGGRLCRLDSFLPLVVVVEAVVACVVVVLVVVVVVVVVVVLPVVVESWIGFTGVVEERGVLTVTAELDLSGGSTTKVFLSLLTWIESVSLWKSSGGCCSCALSFSFRTSSSAA